MRRRRLRFAILAALPCLAAATAVGQNADLDPARLESVERDLKQSENEAKRLATQATSLGRDVEKLRADSITLAAEIQDQEYSLLVMENRIKDLDENADQAAETLGRRDVQMRDALMALQRIALHPADALTLHPLTPDDAVRSAILLRAALPNIQHSTATLQTELADLYRTRTEAAEQREKVAAVTAEMVEKRKHMAALLDQKAAQREKVTARSEAVAARTQKLAQEARDLRALFEKLAEEKARREAEERKVREAELKARAAEAAKEKAAAARVAPPVAPPRVDDVAVSRSFAKARGTLPYPAAGTLAAKFGEAADPKDTAGLRTKGITIRTASGAQVIAPFDGLIAFAGQFRGYGQLLIIEHSEGYHTLLAGIGRIDGAIGQRVLAGEPVGVMDDAAASSLYVELRRDGQPINPLPWLADRTGKVASR